MSLSSRDPEWNRTAAVGHLCLSSHCSAGIQSAVRLVGKPGSCLACPGRGCSMTVEFRVSLLVTGLRRPQGSMKFRLMEMRAVVHYRASLDRLSLDGTAVRSSIRKGCTINWQHQGQDWAHDSIRGSTPLQHIPFSYLKTTLLHSESDNKFSNN